MILTFPPEIFDLTSLAVEVAEGGRLPRRRLPKLGPASTKPSSLGACMLARTWEAPPKDSKAHT